jgi:hypothetical protein
MKGLYEKLSLCRTEEEVKYEFAKFFKYKIDTRERIDMYTPEILFEFKLHINMDSVQARAKAIAQALYYIRKLTYGRDARIPSARICIVDKNEGLFIETEKLKDYYYLSKAPNYDWDLAPSNPCKKLVYDLKNSGEISNLYVYHFNNAESEKEFIERLLLYKNGEQLSFFGNKKEINELNFYEIFQYWNSLFGAYVENGRKSSEYFMTDIEQGRTSILDGAQVLFRMNSGENITKYLPVPQYEHFWNTYERINDRKQVEGIRQKMDRMSEITLRRFTGEFFTPLEFADKALDYLERIVGRKWWSTGKYRLWDMAAGTGNLEYLLPADAMKYCYISTLFDDDAEYCKSLYPDATVFQYDYLNDDVNILEHPVLLEMGITYKMPSNLVEDLKNPEIKWILFFNPPYATSNNNARDKSAVNKDKVSMTKIHELMKENGLKEASRELMSQFLYRISMEFAGKVAYIAMFSKIKYMNSNNDQKLRDTFFNYKYEKGFIFSSKNFDGCKAKFPVGFIIWNMGKSVSLDKQNICVDVYNEVVEKIGLKDIKIEKRTCFLSKWIVRDKGSSIMPPLSSALTVAYENKDKRDRVADGFLASLMCKGNDLANQNYTALLSSPYVSAGALSVTENNFEKAMIVHTVRRLPKASWLNDRDQFMQPKEDVLSDEKFVSNCVLWSLFSNSNNTVSMSNVKYEGKKYRIKNQMYPFLIEDLKKWEIPKADIKAQIWAKHGERFAAVWLSEHTISETGRKLINKAETIYRYFYLHFNEVAWPKFEIRNWDAGWWQIKMALNDAGLAQELLEELYVVHKELGDEIKPLIYKYQFLEPDMRDVNV